MNPPVIDLNSPRAEAARLGARIGKRGYLTLVIIAWVGGVAGVAGGILGNLSAMFFGAAVAIASSLPAIWWKRYLSVVPVSGPSFSDRLSVDVLTRLKPGTVLTPVVLWQILSDHWQAKFFSHHLLLSPELIGEQLSNDPNVLVPAYELALELADRTHSPTVEVGFIVAGLLSSEPKMRNLIIKVQLRPEDTLHIAIWLGRILDDIRRDRQDFGGVGRDWAFGFTTLLNRYGENISIAITKYNSHYGWLTRSAGVQAIEGAFDNHAAAVALIGPEGIGKTTSIYALAQRLIEGNTTPRLAYHQIISLKASVILSAVQGIGQLERIMLAIANEAAHAGHVILFFDDAQLFFNNGPGSFDASHILLPVLQARSVPVIFAFNPGDYQRLKASNATFGGLLTPVILQEMPENDVLRVMEDAALNLESRNKVIISYDALHEAYRLSGRYEQEEAYPGKAIKLLEQAVTHADTGIVSTRSVQQALEQTHGVKVGTAGGAEADTLLNLEAKIHERMINQTHAVSVVASALRRSRAGVANPRRPIGSFLFLGPTGVGKTELAKAIAATYFNDANALIRLDMSEYQQESDVARLLAGGQNESSSLILSVRQQPFAVVLLDEIEKAHPNILNLLLQLLDEGQLTDASGRAVSFKDCVIIATSNAGATTIRDRVAAGQDIESFRENLTEELIQSNQFKPELINRFDELVVFRPLTPTELMQVVRLMLKEINLTLANQNISLDLSDAAVAKIVEVGNDPRLGARPMRRALQRAVEDVIAQKILRGEVHAGDHVLLDVADLNLT